MLPIPKKLLAQGVRDMVRVSDARMSGTSYGACVLHVAPESFVGGPLALVRDGDIIELDVPERRLTLHVSRRGAGAPPGGVDAARDPVSARLRPAVRAARHASRPRVRFRFPRRHRADRGSGDSLNGRGSRFAVRGSRFASSRFAVRSSRFAVAVRGSRFAVRGSRFAARGGALARPRARFHIANDQSGSPSHFARYAKRSPPHRRAPRDRDTFVWLGLQSHSSV